MKTLTVKVPEDLELKLAAVATKKGESKSTLIRAAIEAIGHYGEVCLLAFIGIVGGQLCECLHPGSPRGQSYIAVNTAGDRRT